MKFSINIKYVVLTMAMILVLTAICVPLVLNRHNQAISAIKMTIAGEGFTIEIASTSDARNTGYMYRREVSGNVGMLFVYPRPERLAFFMKNCLVDLDILYLRPDGTITDIITMKAPRGNAPLPHYSSSEKVLYALELPAERAKQLHLKVGQRIEIPASVKKIKAESRGK